MLRDAAADHRIPLVQYWHDGNPPAEVRKRLNSWRIDPRFDRQLFDDATAGAFLVNHFDERTYRAFSSCDLPEMRADFFRYAALLVRGGAYVDADALNLGGAAELFASAERGMLFLRGADEEPARPGWRPGRIPNGLMYVRAPGDRTIAAALEQAITNIEGKVSNNVWEVTGPGIMTAVWGRGGAEAEEYFRGFTIASFEETAEKVARFGKLPYKDGPRYWRKHGEPGFGSIFREPQPPRIIRRRLGGPASMQMFRQVVELDRAFFDDPSPTREPWADLSHPGEGEDDLGSDKYVGKRDVRLHLEWIDGRIQGEPGVTKHPDVDRDRLAGLAGVSARRDREVLANLGLRAGGLDLNTIGLYNAEDFLLQRSVPMPDSMVPRTILDFGAGYGRQANLAFHSGDAGTETLIAVEWSPRSYLTQRAYFEALGLNFAEYLERRRRGRSFDVAELAKNHDVLHLPLWRVDLVPDESVDLALLVRVSQEMRLERAVSAITHAGRVLKPGGALYVRDHLQQHSPDEQQLDQLLLAGGLVLEHLPAVRDGAGVAGAPRMWRKRA